MSAEHLLAPPLTPAADTRITVSVGSELHYSMIGGLMGILLISCISLCIFSFLLFYMKTNFLPLEQMELHRQFITISLRTFLSVVPLNKRNNSCICSFKICRIQWRDQGSNTFSMSKIAIISLRGAEPAVFRMMDYDQFDEDVCQHNISSDGVSN